MVGSYPTGGLPPEEALDRAVADQLEAGIDLISDGQVRSSMLGIFAGLPGLVPGSPPRVVGRVDPSPEPVTLADLMRARERAGTGRVKGILTGPATLARCCRLDPRSPYRDASDPHLLEDLARALAAEARALVEAGFEVVQVDEPVLSAGGDLAAIFRALERITRVIPTSVLHVCGDVRGVWRELRRAPVAVLDLECSDPASLPPFSRRDLGTRRLAWGCVTTHTAEVEPLERVRERMGAALSLVGEEKIAWFSPDCGMRHLPREAARDKLRLLVRAAHTL